MRTLLALAFAATLAAADDFAEVDYGQIDRSIAKEPAYISTPRYALFLLDPAGRFRVWAVADKSKDAKYPDILYMDLDGDGDLTEEGERFEGRADPKLAAAGMEMTIRVGDIAVPGTKIVHTKFLVSTSPKEGRKGFWFRMMWDGKTEVSGGYAPVGIDTTEWAASAAAAPILRPTPLGPLSFAIWGSHTCELKIGGDTHISLVAGSLGSGPDTLGALDENFLDLGKDEIKVTVIAKDMDGGEVKTTSRIKGHC